MSSPAKGLALFSALDERLVHALASGALKLLRADFLLAEEVCGPKMLMSEAEQMTPAYHIIGEM